jgi:hypothetical protein
MVTGSMIKGLTIHKKVWKGPVGPFEVRFYLTHASVRLYRAANHRMHASAWPTAHK